MAIPKKVADRLNKSISKFQTVLKIAKDKDINESDTVQIITDMLAEIFGYDKYNEVTSELAIKGTYCDLAIKIENKIQFLIECKEINKNLKEMHLRQVIDYGAKQGVSWVILTNGILWEIYKIKFEQPISYDLICTLDFLNISHKREDIQEKLFLICKEGLSKDVREDFYEKMQVVNKFVIGALLLSEPITSVIRRELRKYADGLKIEESEIIRILTQEVLKREITEGEEADKTNSKVKRFYKKNGKKKDAAKDTSTTEETLPVTEQTN
ncbi:Type I restriction enzyme R protein N terminus (HSDR_N) [Parelusimicrobium proximum]|uniref:type I restriction enzyme HsdR N-terminal domain-containing protein n=1 Tax=Parelusimicrobium proximum TaxID=3228953 RepID=UPI003D1798F6